MKRARFLGAATAYAVSSRAFGARAADVTLVPFVVAPPTGPGAAGLYYAMREGWFQQAGLDITVQHPQGAAAIPGVVGGSLQVAYGNVFSLCEAYAKGVPVTLIAPGVAYASPTAFTKIIVAADSPLRTPKDLAGKTVAVFPLSGMAAYSVQGWLSQSGADPSAVRFVEIPTSAMPAALDQKRVDAVVVYDPYLTAAETDGARVLGKPFDSIATNFLDAAWFTALPYAQAHRDLVAKFVAVINRGAQYYDTHYAELIPLISDVSKIPPDVLKKMPPEQIPATLTPASIQPVIDAAASHGAIPKTFPAKELIFV